jgi:hypothetical protein
VTRMLIITLLDLFGWEGRWGGGGGSVFLSFQICLFIVSFFNFYYWYSSRKFMNVVIEFITTFHTFRYYLYSIHGFGI